MTHSSTLTSVSVTFISAMVQNCVCEWVGVCERLKVSEMMKADSKNWAKNRSSLLLCRRYIGGESICIFYHCELILQHRPSPTLSPISSKSWSTNLVHSWLHDYIPTRLCLARGVRDVLFAVPHMPIHLHTPSPISVFMYKDTLCLHSSCCRSWS